MVLKTETINSLLRMASGAISSKDRADKTPEDGGNNAKTEVCPDTKAEEDALRAKRAQEAARREATKEVCVLTHVVRLACFHLLTV